MLNLEHFSNLWEFIDVHIYIHDLLCILCTYFGKHRLKELAWAAPVGTCLEHNRFITLQVLVPVGGVLHFDDG